jgi:hypothetical protein
MRTTDWLLWMQLLIEFFFSFIGGDYLNGLGVIYGKDLNETIKRRILKILSVYIKFKII